MARNSRNFDKSPEGSHIYGDAFVYTLAGSVVLAIHRLRSIEGGGYRTGIETLLDGGPLGPLFASVSRETPLSG